MPDLAAQSQMLANRVKKTFRALGKKFEKSNVGAFRVYDWDIPELRLVVDWYEGHLVAAEYARTQTDLIPNWLETMAAACAGALGVTPDKVHVKRRRTRPAEGVRYTKLAATGVRFPVREGPCRFLVNLDDYIDTGLFGDHRETRALVRAQAAGKSVLNLFCYTGAFTCAAASGGAKSTTSVDVSPVYLDWLKENLALNSLTGPQHELIRADAREFLRLAAGQGRTWDVIVCDPPSFSTRREKSQEPGSDADRARGGRDGESDFDVQRDHPELVSDCLARLTPGGTLWFSTNHQRFEPRLDELGPLCAELKEVTAETLPPDYRRQAHRCFRITRAT
jgi:23S rRNA G2069 N7-methylase RlmK/C1962 C5-methylase RlmI